MPQEMGSDDIAIDVERADTDEDEDKFDTRRFALSSVMPGKRPIAWTLAIAVLACSWPGRSGPSMRRRATSGICQAYHGDRSG